MFYKKKALFTRNIVSGLVVPEDPNFSVSDVRSYVGSRRKVDVMECKTQRALEMSMREFERYFLGSDRRQIYNVISLEFSQSKLAHLIKRPTVVDSLDWIDLVWPQHLKNIQTDQTNILHSMKYPKVQKYCLMSVAGCYTDFHIDFGGTSVWYHILKGGKIFWLIPPTDANIALFERWTLSGSQGDTFLGDVVQKCQRVELEAGNSLMIPSGWIHAVYTPKDSLVFGGNFLNSFNISMQLRISHLEEKLKVPNRFRFPFFTDVLWYALERYVHTFTGKSYLTEEFIRANKLSLIDSKSDNSNSNVHLTPFEHEGLRSLIEELQTVYEAENSFPEGIVTPNLLLLAGKKFLEEHSDDDATLAVTGKPKAYWPVTSLSKSVVAAVAKKTKVSLPSTNGSAARSGAGKVRRVRCKQCEGCLSEDCRECAYCRDMIKYGGRGTLKQSCVKRKCQNPKLSINSKFSSPTTDTTSMNKSADNEQCKKRKSSKTDLEGSSVKKAKVTRNAELIISNGNGQVPIPAVVISRVTTNDLIKYTSKLAKPQSPSKTDLNNISLQDLKSAWISIFKYLDAKDLENCKLVCTDFLNWCRPRLSANSEG